MRILNALLSLAKSLCPVEAIYNLLSYFGASAFINWLLKVTKLNLNPATSYKTVSLRVSKLDE